MDILEILKIAALSMLMGYVLAMFNAPDMDRDALIERYFRNRNASKKIKPNYVLIILVTVGSLSFVRDVIVGSTPYGSTTIGGVLEKGQYTEEYYVFAFPDKSESLNYKVKAQIHSQRKYDGLESKRTYEVEKIHLPQGDYATFGNAAGTGYSLALDREVALHDDNGRQWVIRLTSEKVLP